MSDHNSTELAPNGCPIDTHPEDPTHLFSSSGLNLDLPRIGWIASGCFTLVSTAISLVLIYRHLQYYTKPNQQRYIVRMLLMVPIYAITSWFSFVYVREAVYYDKIRILYEAFVIASFFILMLQYLGDSLEEQRRVLKRHRKTERWFFPLCCLKYNPSRPHFLQYMKWGILQYVPLNVLGTILTIILVVQGSYCESSWNPKFGHVWILLISTTSVTIATYFLIMFYFTIREDLKEYSPFYKFLAVKLVVFFSFWQAIVIEGLVYFGLIKATTYWSTADISVGINAILIDVEMVFFAIMHLKAFSYKPYVPLIQNPDLPEEKRQALLQSLDNDKNDSDKNNFNDNHKDYDNRQHKQLMASLRSERPAHSSRRQGSSQRSFAARRPPSGADPYPESDPTLTRSKSKSKSGSKQDKEMNQDLPDMIMDLSQKTPIWKGLLDSFNPLDTIRELAYGVKYLYRWARGIPVDKDSRRLLDLERAFGRQRPEVPYIPPKDKDEKDKKKKKKKGEDDNSLDSGDDDSEKNGGGSEADEDNDGGKEKYRYQDWDQSWSRDRNKDRDVDRGYGSGKERAEASRYRQFPDDSANGQTGGASSQRPADAVYEMGYSGSGHLTNSMRMAGGVGAISGTMDGRSPALRKPVNPLSDTPSGNVTSGGNGHLSTSAAGIRIGQGKQQQRIKKENVEYLAKEDAARTERATLPDILPERVEKKVALSGLYVGPPPPPVDIEDDLLSPQLYSSSSPDIPVSMTYGHQDQYHYQQQRQYSFEPQDYDLQSPRARPDWTEERDRERQHLLLGETEILPLSRFEHRDRELERAANGTPYMLPTPVVPRSTRPNIASGDPYQLQRENELVNPQSIVVSISTAQPDIHPADQEHQAAAVLDLVAQQPFDDRTLPVAHERVQSGETFGKVFYHQREASQSDPEVSRYGHSHDDDDDERYYQEQELRHEPTIAAQQQSLPDLPPPKDDIDPVIAQYNQLQYRQKVQEQEQQLQQLQQLQQQQQQLRPQQSRPPIQPQQRSSQALESMIRKTIPPRRRNSLESLDSDSSGGFRVRAIAGVYDRRDLLGRQYGGGYSDRDRDKYGYGYRDGHSGRDGERRGEEYRREYGYVPSHPKEGRYQRAYRYPMPLPQGMARAQFYRFPEDRELYQQRRREQQERLFDRDQQLPYGASMRTPPPAQRREHEREQDQGLYQPSRLHQRPQPVYSHSFYDDLSQFVAHQRPAPPQFASYHNGAQDQSSDPRYRILDPGAAQSPRTRGLPTQMPIPMPNYPAQPQAVRRSTMDYADNRIPPSRIKVEAGAGSGYGRGELFPASRYAAPFGLELDLSVDVYPHMPSEPTCSKNVANEQQPEEDLMSPFA
ncbi:hypothetical protein EDD11_006363 [Mortierella claussenii]|nr:hypothetical protein EDD11_006363 [Mortierella claussenii]